MNPETPTFEPAGGDGLMFLIAIAVIVVVAAEAAFIALGSWLFMIGVLAGVIVAALGVVTALVRMMSDPHPPGTPTRPTPLA